MARSTVWIVECGSLSVAPYPEYNSELAAIARYNEEILIPSYFNPNSVRRAAVVKKTTIKGRKRTTVITEIIRSN